MLLPLKSITLAREIKTLMLSLGASQKPPRLKSITLAREIKTQLFAFFGAKLSQALKSITLAREIKTNESVNIVVTRLLP